MTKQSHQNLRKDEEYRPKNQAKFGSQKKKSVVFQNHWINSSKWNLEQNRRFLEFVRINRKTLACPKRRKEQKVFLQLSKLISTRTPDQCRSHHQKMIKHHNDFDGIISHLERIHSNNSSSYRSLQKVLYPEIIVKIEQKVQNKFFLDTIIAVEVESENIAEKNLWDILDEQIWIQRPIWLTKAF